MNKKIFRVLIFIVVLFGVISTLNIEVSTKQGIDYKVSTIRIPLYLKVLDFFDRHYNYKWMVKRIIGNTRPDKEKVLKILQWTYENIKESPAGYPVIDDHVWHIIVRGYGVNDQSADVFTTLCNYAGVEAFFDLVSAGDSSVGFLPFAFVLVDKKWSVFNPYNGVYFVNRQGELADVEDILNGDWVEHGILAPGQGLLTGGKRLEVNYSAYFGNLKRVIGPALKRASIQSPVKRLEYEVKKWLKLI